MDQEKRPILAILLILLIFLGFSYWNTRQRETRVSEEPAPTEVTTDGRYDGAAVEPSSGAPEPVTEETADAESMPEEEAEYTGDMEERGFVDAESPPSEEITTVETSLWTAKISNRGATIVSWELKEYDDTTGEPVQLVPRDGAALKTLLNYGGRPIDTSELMFEGPGETTIEPRGEQGFSMLGYKAETADGLRLTRQYTFYPETYSFELYVSVQGLDEPAAQREVEIGWPGVHPTEEKEDERADRASVVMVDGGAERLSLGNLKDEERVIAGDISWATSQAKYFMAAVIPKEGSFSRVVAYADTSGEAARFEATAELSSGETAREFFIYAGPQDFQAVSSLGVDLEEAVYLGWPWIRPLSALMLRALIWAYGLIPNYGVVIILFSVLTKLLFYRLTHKSFTAMKRMQEVQPKLKEIQEKYKDNREELSKKQMELYKKEGVNPLGSCLPMLLQMPVFVALFQVLRTTIELRGAPFALWITDLSQPDTIATVAGFSIHILPLLMGVGMLVQQKFSSTDPSQAAMGKLMPIVFTVIFYNIASGLVLYWFVNTVLSIAQQYYIHHGRSSDKEKSRDEAAPQGVPAAGDVSSSTEPPEFADAEVVEDRSESSKRPKKGGGRRRKKKRRK
ncbi:MAG: membrane protein insertase YidC [Candidatus Eisenbacteria bacterium]|nr:membrane protein insertase YidC [Candidatus Eisenbacteria bacterium]